jgi:phosphoketolase
VRFNAKAARELVKNGAIRMDGAGYQQENAKLVLSAIGAYQLTEVLKASERLKNRKVAHAVIYMLEPRRWSRPKDKIEARMVVTQSLMEKFYPKKVKCRLFVTHTRAGRIEGLFQETLNTGAGTLALGYINEGGTLSTDGILFINRQSWAHIVDAAGRLLEIPSIKLLSADEIAVLDHRKSPHGILF